MGSLGGGGHPKMRNFDAGIAAMRLEECATKAELAAALKRTKKTNQSGQNWPRHQDGRSPRTCVQVGEWRRNGQNTRIACRNPNLRERGLHRTDKERIPRIDEKAARRI